MPHRHPAANPGLLLIFPQPAQSSHTLSYSCWFSLNSGLPLSGVEVCWTQLSILGVISSVLVYHLPALGHEVSL